MHCIRRALYSSICRTCHISQITCVRWTKTVTNYCYVNKQIHLTLLSTDIKILQISFDILTNRLTPSATDQLLIMYGIFLWNLFLCCRSCVPWVMWFLIWLTQTPFCYGIIDCLFHQTDILKWFFEWQSLT